MERVLFFLVRLRGIEPPHTVPETIALSTELQAQKLQWNYTTDVKLMQRKAFFFVLCALICYNNIIVTYKSAQDKKEGFSLHKFHICGIIPL